MKTEMMKYTRGFTLVELLISLGLLGAIIVTLFQTMGSTTQVSNSTNSSNDLIREGQIAQQLLSARFKEACYVYPAGQSITLNSSGYTTKNSGTGAYAWVINTHPMIAMIMPPDSNDLLGASAPYRFVAYYAITRNQYISGSPASSSSNPGSDAVNDSTTWILMEYRQNIPLTSFPSGSTCAQIAADSATPTTISGGDGRYMTDYITPVATSTDLLSVGGTFVGGSAAFVQYNLRLSRTTREGNTVTVGGGASGTTMSAKVYPVNLGL